jgi:integrase
LEHNVPLSDVAVETIESLPKIASTRKLLFTTGERPASGFSRAKIILDKKMKVEGEELPHWILHDLRRTVATEMQKLSIPPHVTEAVLNHKSGTIKGIAAIYQQHDYADEKKTALDAWGRRLMAIINPEAAHNVVPLYAAEA